MTKARIVISGASTGIGFATAVALTHAGHQVFAGVRKSTDGETLLLAAPQCQILKLDVTDTQQITHAVTAVKSESNPGLPLILINNAGIAMAGPIECLPVAEFRKQFEVNVFAVIDMIQQFSPMVRESQGRIINISSISGRLAAPFLGPYSASKFALEGLSDALRRELAPLGVKVALIEPGPIQTPIWEKGLSGREGSLGAMDPERLKIYEHRLGRFMKFVQQSGQNADPVELVVRAIEQAAFSKNPQARYFVGGQAKAGNFISRLPTKWVDRLLRMSARGI